MVVPCPSVINWIVIEIELNTAMKVAKPDNHTAIPRLTLKDIHQFFLYSSINESQILRVVCGFFFESVMKVKSVD
jgi:hypothetical protein